MQADVQGRRFLLWVYIGTVSPGGNLSVQSYNTISITSYSHREVSKSAEHSFIVSPTSTPLQIADNRHVL